LLLAQKENKPIFLDVYAVWCGPCKALKKNTFPDPDVGEYYNEHFINVTLDGEKGDGVNVAGELKVQAYPSLFILDSSGNPLVYYPGYLSPTEFLELGKVGIEKNKY
jgi:thioredoxin 1